MKNKIINNKNFYNNIFKIIIDEKFLFANINTQENIIYQLVNHLSNNILSVNIDNNIKDYAIFNHVNKQMTLNTSYLDNKIKQYSIEKQNRYRIYSLLNSIFHETEHSLQVNNAMFKHNLENIIDYRPFSLFQPIEEDAYNTSFEMLDFLSEQFPDLFYDINEFKEYVNNEKNNYYQNKQSLINCLKLNKYGTLENRLNIIEQFEKIIHDHFEQNHLDRKSEAQYHNLEFFINRTAIICDIDKTDSEWQTKIYVKSNATKKNFIFKQLLGYEDFFYALNINLFGSTAIIQPNKFDNTSMLSYLENDEIAKQAIAKLISNYQRAEQTIIENIIYAPIDLSIKKEQYIKAIKQNANYICPEFDVKEKNGIFIHTIQNIPSKDNEINELIDKKIIENTKNNLINILQHCTENDIQNIISNREKFDILNKNIIKRTVLECIQNNKNIFKTNNINEINKKLSIAFKNITILNASRKKTTTIDNETIKIANSIFNSTPVLKNEQLDEIIKKYTMEISKENLNIENRQYDNRAR